MGKLKQWRRNASGQLFDVAAWVSYVLVSDIRRGAKAIENAADVVSDAIRRAGGRVRGCGCIHVDAEGCHGEWCECACHTLNVRMPTTEEIKEAVDRWNEDDEVDHCAFEFNGEQFAFHAHPGRNWRRPWLTPTSCSLPVSPVAA